MKSTPVGSAGQHRRHNAHEDQQFAKADSGMMELNCLWGLCAILESAEEANHPKSKTPHSKGGSHPGESGAVQCLRGSK